MAEDPRRRRACVRRQNARCRKDGPSQGTGRGAETEGGRQGRGSGDAARQGQGRREVEARRRGRREGRCQGGRNQEGRRRQGGKRGKLTLEPVSVYISRATQKLYVRRNTHKPWPDGGE